MSKVEIISKDFYSNCLIEAIKAKIKNHKVKITYVSPFNNEVFCPHFLWSDGVNDYDFGYENYLPLRKAWILHRGHIRKCGLGYNAKYKRVCKKFAEKHRGKK